MQNAEIEIAWLLKNTLSALSDKGFALREDVASAARTALEDAVRKVPVTERRRVLHTASDTMMALLRAADLEDPRHLAVAVSLLALRMVEEEHFSDPTCKTVLVALLLVDEAREFDPEGWRYDDQKITAAAGRMLALKERDRAKLFAI